LGRKCKNASKSAFNRSESAFSLSGTALEIVLSKTKNFEYITSAIPKTHPAENIEQLKNTWWEIGKLTLRIK